MYTRVLWGRIAFVSFVAVVTLMSTSAVQFLQDTDNEITVFLNNEPPDKPTLEGPRVGEPDTPYSYTACATDPDGDRIFYSFDWGDGCQVTMSCCFASGECCTACYCWAQRGIYHVRVCAVDEHLCYGEWSDTLPVSMPKNLFHDPVFIISSPLTILNTH